MSDSCIKNGTCNTALEMNSELISRREKLAQLRKKGIAFANNFRRDATSDQLHATYDKKNKDELENLSINVSVAGRMMTRRIMGKAAFATIQDAGGRVQLYVVCGELIKSQCYEQFERWDLGDIIGARGKLFKTRTNELSIYCSEICLLTKSIRPLPDKFHGLSNQEIRYRQRYLDLISNDRSRRIFKIRSCLIAEIRQFMAELNFIEVETPIMQIIPGGANARPFVTHHNALDIDMYLRVAPELYLKQLIIGGFERIFEINRNFRNEGLSPIHNPEFTMMELYMAYADYRDLITLIENLLRTITKKVLGSSIIRYGSQLFDFSKPFVKMTMKEAICFYQPEINSRALDNIISATAVAKSLDIEINQSWKLGRIQTEIFKKTAERHLIQPTFIIAYPIEVSPLARRNDENPFFADRFELFIGGYEIGNGFSELNDAEDQSTRLIEQNMNKNSGDCESMLYDEDYITALEYGLPPTAGLGIGIDRLIMLLTDSHTIRDVILFPSLRPKK